MNNINKTKVFKYYLVVVFLFGFIGIIYSAFYNKEVPRYAVGDCLMFDLGNEFESDKVYYKVLKVGKESYLVKWKDGEAEGYFMGTEVISFRLSKYGYEKVDNKFCP